MLIINLLQKGPKCIINIMLPCEQKLLRFHIRRRFFINSDSDNFNAIKLKFMMQCKLSHGINYFAFWLVTITVNIPLQQVNQTTQTWLAVFNSRTHSHRNNTTHHVNKTSNRLLCGVMIHQSHIIIVMQTNHGELNCSNLNSGILMWVECCLWNCKWKR